MNLGNNIKKIFTEKEEPLQELLPWVIMELGNSLLTEADQILKFNKDIGTCNVAKAEAVTCSEEALDIMKEANLAAEKALRDRFPSIQETRTQRLGIKT